MAIVRKTGAFFSYGDTRLGQGRENAKEFLKRNGEIADQIERQIRDQAITKRVEPDEPTTDGVGAVEELESVF
jgi:recombination protein RecA